MNFLIVDDEVWSRRCIIDLISNSDVAISSIFEAEDGTSALEIIACRQIDIVFSDIRMPEMDGLTLIEKIQEVSPHTKCAIITGYNDFSYAKTAISLGVIDFVLKPIQKQDVLLALKKMVAKVQQENDLLNSISTMQSLSHNQSVKHLFSQIIHDGDNNKFFAEQLLYLLKCEEGLYSCICISLKLLLNSSEKDHDRDKTIIARTNRSLVIIQDIFLNAVKRTGAIIASGYNVHHVFIVSQGCKPHELLRSVNDSIKRYFEIKGEQDLCSVQFGLGSSGCNVEDIGLSYQQSINHLLSNIFFSYPSVDNTKTQIIDKYQLFADFESILLQNVSFGNKEKTKSEIVSIANLIRTAHSIDLLDEFLLHCSLLGIKILMRENIIQNQSGLQKLNTDLLCYEHFKDLVSCIEKYFISICHQVYKDDIPDSDRAVRIMCAYIEEHYSEELSLANLAQRIGFSSSYLCSIFKETMHIGYVDYLKNIRMKNACLLLRNSNLPIYRVSLMVGYEDEQYFSTVFKKVFGLTPTQYRKEGADKILSS